MIPYLQLDTFGGYGWHEKELFPQLLETWVTEEETRWEAENRRLCKSLSLDFSFLGHFLMIDKCNLHIETH